MVHTVQALGAAIPAIGFGTWELRGPSCTELVLGALSCGYRHIDTAGMYQNEAEVGRAIAASGIDRDDIFLTTKVWLDDLGPGRFQQAAEAGLSRLGTDFVDLLLIHWPRPDLSMGEMIDPLMEMKERGLARHVGVSNFPTDLLKQAWDVSGGVIVTNQCEYHPYLDQNKVLSACRERGMSFTSYCPIGRAECFNDHSVRQIADDHEKTPSQVILRWQVQQDGVIAIPRSSRVAHIEENIKIDDFTLSDDEMAEISDLRSKNRRICDYGFSPIWDSV